MGRGYITIYILLSYELLTHSWLIPEGAFQQGELKYSLIQFSFFFTKPKLHS